MEVHHIEAGDNNEEWTQVTWSVMVTIGRAELTEQFGLATDVAAALVANMVAGAWRGEAERLATSRFQLDW
jgi:hypothetical protein